MYYLILCNIKYPLKASTLFYILIGVLPAQEQFIDVNNTNEKRVFMMVFWVTSSTLNYLWQLW